MPTTDIYNALRESLSLPIITLSAVTVSSLADRKNMAFVIIVRKIIHENDKSNKNKTDDGVETTKTKSREIQMEEQAKYPHWVVYIAWIVVVLSILVPAFFMYHMQVALLIY
jgi:hypothetical protein